MKLRKLYELSEELYLPFRKNAETEALRKRENGARVPLVPVKGGESQNGNNPNTADHNR